MSIPKLFLGFLGLLLLGYAFLGRGFAYIGIPPVFIGEIGLGVGAFVLLAHIIVPLWNFRLAWFLLAFMAWGFLNTMPYIERYGVDALRDAAQWGYALYSLAVATALLRTNWLDQISGWYAGFTRLLLLWTIPAFLIYQTGSAWLPRLPWGPDGGVLLLHPKAGDFAVHLAGILAFSVLRLSEHRFQRWSWHAVWVASALLVAIGSRAAFLTVAVPFIALVFMRPTGHWHRPLFVAIGGFALFLLLGTEFDFGREGRPLTAETLLLGVSSIFQDTAVADFGGTREWRLMWWDEILSYTVFGEYFWTGKGFGLNLATADGFQLFWDDALRSPHNGHLTLLARTGVPGFALWLLLQGSFAWSLFKAYREDRLYGRYGWSDLSLWIFLYWLAFMVNASFDVYLEGPQGGIWFWSVFGVGLAHLVRRRAVLTANRALHKECLPQLVP